MCKAHLQFCGVYYFYPLAFLFSEKCHLNSGEVLTRCDHGIWRGETPGYNYLIKFIKRVSDPLHLMAPKGWKQVMTNNTKLNYICAKK
jgi:hypothetical protein